MLAFTLSVDDFVVSFFTTGSGVTNLSIMIFSMARRGVNPRINALSTLIFIVVMALLYFINLRDQRSINKKEEIIK
jgi:spermidine/putrescine transport system permease protein